MDEKDTSAECNPGENYDFEGFINDNIGDNEWVVPNFDPYSLDIEVSLVRSSEVSSDHTDLWMNGMIIDLTLSVMVLLLLIQIFWTPNFTIEPLN